MAYLLAPHASALQMNTTKFKQDFIGPLFIDTALDKTHYRLKDVTGLLLDGTYHMNHIKKGSAHTPLSIVDKFDMYQTALKNTLLNKFAIEPQTISYSAKFFCLFLLWLCIKYIV